MTRTYLGHTAKHAAGMVLFSTGLEYLVHEETPEDFPRVRTRGQFETEWKDEPLGRLKPTSLRPLGVFEDTRKIETSEKHDPTDYQTAGRIEEVIEEEPDELMIFTHGWLAGERAALGRMSMMAYNLREYGGYEGEVVGFTWDSGDVAVDWKLGKRIAEYNGQKLAQFTKDYHEKTGKKVRYISNSLGSRVVLEALRSLHVSGADDVLRSVSMLGAANHSSSVSVDGSYGRAIRDSAEEVHNYWLNHDGILNQQYRLIEFSKALGGRGAVGEVPENYYDHNVDYVPDHYSFYRGEKGCIREVVADLGIQE